MEANTVIRYLEPEQIDISEIITEMVEANQLIDEGYMSEDEPQDAKPPFNFLTSPADIDPHRKVNLKGFELSQDERQKFKSLCDKFNDISEAQRTLAKHHSSICQCPYTLPLNHAEWVKREIAILEKAGVIIRSVPPWASPMVVVPK